MFVDAHIHVMERLGAVSSKGEARAIGKGKVQFATGEVTGIVPEDWGDREFTIESYIEHVMEPNHIDKGVLIQAGLYGFQNLYYKDVMKRYPGKFVASCTVDPYALRKKEILDYLTSEHQFSILKFETSLTYGLSGYHPELKLDGAEFQDIYEIAASKNMAVLFDVGGYPDAGRQAEELSRMIKKYPEVRFVVAHLLGMNEPMNRRWVEDMRKLTADNVWYDISCLPFFMKEEYPFPRCLELVEYVAERIGSDRMMWGSDVPFIAVEYPVKQLIDYLGRSKKLSSADLENIYGKTAQHVYNIV